MMCSLSYHLLKSCSSAGSASISVMSIPLPASGIVDSSDLSFRPSAQAREPEPMNAVVCSVHGVHGFQPRLRSAGTTKARVGGDSGGLQPARLPAEHGALAGDPPMIAAQVPALAHHPVARHQDRKSVV